MELKLTASQQKFVFQQFCHVMAKVHGITNAEIAAAWKTYLTDITTLPDPLCALPEKTKAVN